MGQVALIEAYIGLVCQVVVEWDLLALSFSSLRFWMAWHVAPWA